MAAEGDPLVETRKNHLVDLLPVPVPLNKKKKKKKKKEKKKKKKKKKKVKGREECEMLEKIFTILTSSEGAAASAGDDECKRWVTFIGKLLRNYLSRIRNKVHHTIIYIVFANYQVLFDVSYPVPTPSPTSHVTSLNSLH